MDELIDVLDVDGNATGETVMKSVAHQQGLFHQSIHVWLYTKDAQLLIQQRAKNKDTHPLFWDVSVAGHIGAGENIELAALREVQEEVGLTITKGNLQKIGVFKSVHKHRKDFIDCEYHHTYLCELKVAIESLTKQESEVADLRLISTSQFLVESTAIDNAKKYVPYEDDYYIMVVTAIDKKL